MNQICHVHSVMGNGSCAFLTILLVSYKKITALLTGKSRMSVVHCMFKFRVSKNITDLCAAFIEFSCLPLENIISGHKNIWNLTIISIYYIPKLPEVSMIQLRESLGINYCQFVGGRVKYKAKPSEPLCRNMLDLHPSLGTNFRP